MLSVYVWTFRGKSEAWGHAALQVGQTYISWWPEKPGQVPSGLHRNIYASHPFRNRSYAEDVAAEERVPDHVVNIDGLDEAAIKGWWQTLGLVKDGVQYHGPMQPWDTLRRNCSTVVAQALRQGGGDKYASWASVWNFVWTPADVLRYARSIQDGLRSSKK
jgi:hypothetical protein